jgi:hypothetical protein
MEHESGLSQCSAIIRAYKIENGFIVRVTGSDPYGPGAVAFCKGHTEIADYIVSQSAAMKLNPQAQYSLGLHTGSGTNPKSSSRF